MSQAGKTIPTSAHVKEMKNFMKMKYEFKWNEVDVREVNATCITQSFTSLEITSDHQIH